MRGAKSSTVKEVDLNNNFNTEQEISDCYGDGRLIMSDVDEALSRLLD